MCKHQRKEKHKQPKNFAYKLFEGFRPGRSFSRPKGTSDILMNNGGNVCVLR